MSRRAPLGPVVLTLALAPLAGCSGSIGTPDARAPADATSDRAPLDASPALDACATCTDARSPGDVVTPPADATPARGVTNPQLLFEGTELDLSRHYGLYLQDDRDSVDIVDDPTGAPGRVIRYRKDKRGEWTHAMVRPLDRRTGYRDAAQITTYDRPYRYTQRMFVRGDRQYHEPSFNLLEDFHCEPCEANNLQIMLNLREEGTVCLWVAYSTDPSFDPRGHNRGSSFDPWSVISPNTIVVPVASDGTPSLPSPMPPTAALLLCRPDLRTADLFDRWVDVELIVRPSSYGTGVVMFWLDGRPYRYNGPNSYRWNELSNDSTPVNTFQIGLYGAAVTPASGLPLYFEMFTNAPRIELGDEIIGP